VKTREKRRKTFKERDRRFINMCMFLYGGINKNADIKDYKKFENGRYYFKSDTINNIKKDLNAHEYNFRISNDHCDCGTFVGKKDENHPDVKELVLHIKEMQNIPDIEWICISKKWWNDDIENEKTYHINDIDLTHLLANLKEKCLYKIQMFRKYY